MYTKFSPSGLVTPCAAIQTLSCRRGKVEHCNCRQCECEWEGRRRDRKRRLEPDTWQYKLKYFFLSFFYIHSYLRPVRSEFDCCSAGCININELFGWGGIYGSGMPRPLAPDRYYDGYALTMLPTTSGTGSAGRGMGHEGRGRTMQLVSQKVGQNLMATQKERATNTWQSRQSQESS